MRRTISMQFARGALLPGAASTTFTLGLDAVEVPRIGAGPAGD